MIKYYYYFLKIFMGNLLNVLLRFWLCSSFVLRSTFPSSSVESEETSDERGEWKGFGEAEIR